MSRKSTVGLPQSPGTYFSLRSQKTDRIQVTVGSQRLLHKEKIWCLDCKYTSIWWDNDSRKGTERDLIDFSSVVKTWSKSRWAEFLIHPNGSCHHDVITGSCRNDVISDLKYKTPPLFNLDLKFCIEFGMFVYTAVTHHYWYSTAQGKPFSVPQQWQLWALGAILYSASTSKLHLSIPRGPPGSYSTIDWSLYISTSILHSASTSIHYSTSDTQLPILMTNRGCATRRN